MYWCYVPMMKYSALLWAQGLHPVGKMTLLGLLKWNDVVFLSSWALKKKTMQPSLSGTFNSIIHSTSKTEWASAVINIYGSTLCAKVQIWLTVGLHALQILFCTGLLLHFVAENTQRKLVIVFWSRQPKFHWQNFFSTPFFRSSKRSFCNAIA